MGSVAGSEGESQHTSSPCSPLCCAHGPALARERRVAMEWEDVLPAKPVEYRARDGKLESMEEIMLHPYSRFVKSTYALAQWLTV